MVIPLDYAMYICSMGAEHEKAMHLADMMQSNNLNLENLLALFWLFIPAFPSSFLFKNVVCHCMSLSLVVLLLASCS